MSERRKIRLLVEQQRVIRLPVGKRLAAGLAAVGAGLNVPLVHEHPNLTTNVVDGHEEIFCFDTDSRINTRLKTRLYLGIRENP